MENAIRFLLIGVSILQWIVIARYLKRAKAGASIFQRREEGTLLAVSIAAAYLVFVAGVLAYFINPDWMDWSQAAVPMWVRWTGIVPLLAGAGLLNWGLHHLGTNLTISISTKDDHALTTSGPYRWVRHPLYTGGMVESAGLGLMTANWFVTVSAVLFWTLIACRTPLEEQKLVKEFGEEYRRYMRRVGRFFPMMRR